MNVGRVNRLSGLYHYNSVNRVGAVGLPQAEQRIRETPAPQTRGEAVAGRVDTRSLSRSLAAVFSTADGDQAEISKKAMDLWREFADGKNPAPATMFSERQDMTLPFDHKFDLPSPLINWDALANSAPPPSVQPAPLEGPPLPTALPPAPTSPSQSALPETPPVTATAEGALPPVAASPGAAPPPIGTAPVNDQGNEDRPGAKPPDVVTGSFKFDPIEPKGECKTCESRRYVDRSDDPSVSFQTPTRLSPNMAASAVASHENEHVSHEKGKAQREDREIVNQSVTFKYDVCPECGRNFISGGTTHTTSIKKSGPDDTADPAAAAGEKD